MGSAADGIVVADGCVSGAVVAGCLRGVWKLRGDAGCRADEERQQADNRHDEMQLVFHACTIGRWKRGRRCLPVAIFRSAAARTRASASEGMSVIATAVIIASINLIRICRDRQIV